MRPGNSDGQCPVLLYICESPEGLDWSALFDLEMRPGQGSTSINFLFATLLGTLLLVEGIIVITGNFSSVRSILLTWAVKLPIRVRSPKTPSGGITEDVSGRLTGADPFTATAEFTRNSAAPIGGSRPSPPINGFRTAFAGIDETRSRAKGKNALYGLIRRCVQIGTNELPGGEYYHYP